MVETFEPCARNSQKITPRERKRKRQEINPCPSL
nr:MAG TPA: hypothetical protein [Caudoviricetes sp.]